MKMNPIKNLLSIVVILLLVNPLSAQDTYSENAEEPSKKILEHQIGINATFFIQNFVSLNGGFLVGTPYDLNYKILYNFPEKSFLSSAGIRTGFGYQALESNSENVINNSGQENRQVSYDFRIGIEAQKRISKYWKVYAGLDYIIGSTDNKFVNKFISGNQLIRSEVNSKGSSSGFGPVYGIQFDFNKYISLATELTLYSTTTTSDMVSTNGFPNSLPQVTKSKTRQMNIITPTFINFIVRF